MSANKFRVLLKPTQNNMKRVPISPGWRRQSAVRIFILARSMTKRTDRLELDHASYNLGQPHHQLSIRSAHLSHSSTERAKRPRTDTRTPAILAENGLTRRLAQRSSTSPPR